MDDIGRVPLITMALYDKHIAGGDFWYHLQTCMDELGFTSNKVAPALWYNVVTTANDKEYYEYVILYTDDCLVISEISENIIRKEIRKYFKLKEESIGPPS